MKLLIAIFSLIFIPKECNNMSSSFNELQKRQDTITIIYEANSRGFFEEITVSKNILKICNDLNRKDYETIELDKKSWTDCLELLSEINLDSLSDLKAPTSMRYVDGAPHATLIVKDDGNKIQSSTFDHGHPPKEIKKLVEKLLALKKIITKQ